MINERDFIDEMVLTATNQGDFYPHDPKGAASAAFDDFVRRLRRDWREDYQAKVVQLVADHWKGE